MTDTRLTPARYLDVLHREGERLLVAAQDIMDRPVPACEGWTVDDVVFHVGGVYAHKLAALRLGRRPEAGEWAVPAEEATVDDDLAWCHAMLHAVATELAHRPADEPAWTWWPGEQTVGFWQRRMAHETAVHRCDVESASGGPSPIDDDVALDGIDELLEIHLADAEFAGETGLVVDEQGLVTASIDRVTVSGPAWRVLLWLWGRADDDSVSIAGSADDIAAVRLLLRDATQ
jgi:uncharacterized protein (TIGR03083 family)